MVWLLYKNGHLSVTLQGQSKGLKFTSCSTSRESCPHNGLITPADVTDRSNREVNWHTGIRYALRNLVSVCPSLKMKIMLRQILSFQQLEEIVFFSGTLALFLLNI